MYIGTYKSLNVLKFHFFNVMKKIIEVGFNDFNRSSVKFVNKIYTNT